MLYACKLCGKELMTGKAVTDHTIKHVVDVFGNLSAETRLAILDQFCGGCGWVVGSGHADTCLDDSRSSRPVRTSEE